MKQKSIWLTIEQKRRLFSVCVDPLEDHFQTINRAQCRRFLFACATFHYVCVSVALRACITAKRRRDLSSQEMDLRRHFSLVSPIQLDILNV